MNKYYKIGDNHQARIVVMPPNGVGISIFPPSETSKAIKGACTWLLEEMDIKTHPCFGFHRISRNEAENLIGREAFRKFLKHDGLTLNSNLLE